MEFGDLIRVMPAEGVMKLNLFSFYTFLFFLVVPCATITANGKADSNKTNSLVVYAYDSFVSEWGAGPELIRLFTEETGINVSLVSCGDAGQVLSRAILEKNNPRSDVLIGIDNNLIEAARKALVLEAYKPKAADLIVPKNLRLSEDWLLTPYDWSYFAIIFDSSSGLTPPKSLEDLTKPEYAKRLILMDPRTSTPGLGFLSWTIAVYGNDYLSYWSRLKPSLLTLSPGWDTGYGLFTSGEAPLVISYTTSPAYHVEYEGTNRYQALIFQEGHTMQVEGLGLVKGAKNKENAQVFIDFMLSEKAQSVLPLTQWMYPVSKTVVLPVSYEAAPKAKKTLFVDSEKVSNAVDSIFSVLGK